MSEEQRRKVFFEQGRRKCLDYIIDMTTMSAQIVNMNALLLTDAEIVDWCLQVFNRSHLLGA